MRPPRLASLLGIVVIGGVVLVGAHPAVAANGSGYAGWTVAGTGGSFTGTMTLPTGFPTATFTSDSRGAVAIATSATQPATSSFGQAFGGSTGEQYIGLRPSAGAGSVSTTTYTFATPTPAGTWGVALGDIDAESLTIAATDAAGGPVSASALGFRSAANALGAGDTLTVTETAAGYTIADEQCATVQLRCNTEGATAWFQPAVPLSTLTITSAYVSGAPVYQTWFATEVRAISGTVAVPPDVTPTSPLEVDLSDGSGGIVTSTPVGSDGSYLFDGLAARADYAVAVSPDSVPDGAVAGPPVAVDTLEADVTGADLSIAAEDPEPVESVSGTIIDHAGSPVPGVEVEVSGRSDAGEAVDESAVTDATGSFVLDDVPDGEYALRLSPPADSGLAPVVTTLRVGPGARVLELVLSESVVADPDPDPDPDAGRPFPPAGELAATGPDPLGALGIGLVLTAAGTALLGRRRLAGSGRRRHPSSSWPRSQRRI